MQSILVSPQQNHLLKALPPAGLQRLAPHLEPVMLTYGQILYEPGDALQYVYFPCQSVISHLSVLGSRQTVEVAVTACDGIVGGEVAFGIHTAGMRTLVQIGGSALRLDAQRMRCEFLEHGSWNPALLHFHAALMRQVAQSAACNRFHNIEARLARWLLSASDRSDSRRLYVTQVFLSRILGVRRVGVSAAAASLQQNGLIHYARGQVQLLDPVSLEAVACECYGVVKREYARLLPEPRVI